MAEKTPEPPKGYVFEWDNEHMPPLQFADAIHWRAGTDRCYLTLGRFKIPVQDAPLPEGSTVIIEPVARIVVTVETLKMWAQLLNQAVASVVPQGGQK